DLMTTFAQAFAKTGKRDYRYAAERTFDSLSDEFIQKGLMAGCRVGDEIPLGRSFRTSFSPRRLLDALPNRSDREWAVRALMLEPRRNPLAVPRWVGDVPFDQPKRLESILKQLRAADIEEPKYASLGYADVTCIVIARLIETARLLGDGPR